MVSKNEFYHVYIWQNQTVFELSLVLQNSIVICIELYKFGGNIMVMFDAILPSL